MKMGMMYARYLNVSSVLESRSLFLFGARQTGKSTYLKAQFPEAHYIDLLEADTFRKLSAYPERMRQELPDNTLKMTSCAFFLLKNF